MSAQQQQQQQHKSILKPPDQHATPSSAHHPLSASTRAGGGGAKFDESNIRATFHPADKDYGHIKIEEPKTPFATRGSPQHSTSVDNTNNTGKPNAFDAEQLSNRIEQTRQDQPKAVQAHGERQAADEDEEQKKRAFEEHRKQHYNEFQQARQLLSKEGDDPTLVGTGILETDATKRNTELNARLSQQPK